MLDKCGNPECSRPFACGEGQFFRFRLTGDARPGFANDHAVRHYWLCGRCAETYVLQYHKERGLVIRLRLLIRRENFHRADQSPALSPGT